MYDPLFPENNSLVTGPNKRTLRRLGIGAAAVALLIAVVGAASRINAVNELRAISAQAAVPAVSVLTPSTDEGSRNLVLPGSIQAYNSAPIYARTNGYVSRWLVDIGDHVSAGQTLAVLDAPEVDQQLAQARADYQTALANQRLAASTARRWKAMLAQDAVSQQEADEKSADLDAKSALANAQLANVRRLQALQGFTRLSAPFNGVITSRSAQIGELVVSGTAASQPLFTVSDVTRMRVYVRVPQVYSANVHQGITTVLTLPEYPGRRFTATMTRSTQAVDVQSGAVLVELQADNPDSALKPGAYAQVNFNIGPGSGNGLSLPGSAILYSNNGPSVALVGADDVVTIKPVSIVRDDGSKVVVSGVTRSDRVIDSPPDSIRGGDHVKVQHAAASSAKGSTSAH